MTGTNYGVLPESTFAIGFTTSLDGGKLIYKFFRRIPTGGNKCYRGDCDITVLFEFNIKDLEYFKHMSISNMFEKSNSFISCAKHVGYSEIMFRDKVFHSENDLFEFVLMR